MNVTRNKFAVLPLTLGALIGTLSLGAQTTPPATAPPTCAVAPTSLQNLSIERTLTLSNLLTTITPNVPANILASIAGGAQVIRTRLIYNSQTNTVTDTTFLVAAGSAIPTPLAVDVTGSTIQSYVLNVSQIFTSCQPTPSVLIVGTVGSSNGPFGNFQGAPAAISIGYTTDTPAKINNVVEVVAGAVVAYSADAQGTLTFPAAPVTPPGTTGGAPVIVLSPVFPTQGVFQAYLNPFQINASASTDPNNLPLTYLYSSDKPVNFLPGPNVPNPQITFGGRGDYTITLTVTNSAGVSTTTKFIVEYVGR